MKVKCKHVSRVPISVLLQVINLLENYDFIIIGSQTSDTGVRYYISFSNDQNHDQVCT